MRVENAVYGGEMSAHHYFRDFAYCDSGMIPWLLVAELLCVSNKSLSKLVSERIEHFPCSGEINFKVESIKESLSKISKHFVGAGGVLDETDGLSLEFSDWRFNVRGSNTEPLLRLNVETLGNSALLVIKVAEITQLLRANS